MRWQTLSQQVWGIQRGCSYFLNIAVIFCFMDDSAEKTDLWYFSHLSHYFVSWRQRNIFHHASWSQSMQGKPHTQSLLPLMMMWEMGKWGVAWSSLTGRNVHFWTEQWKLLSVARGANRKWCASVFGWLNSVVSVIHSLFTTCLYFFCLRCCTTKIIGQTKICWTGWLGVVEGGEGRWWHHPFFFFFFSFFLSLSFFLNIFFKQILRQANTCLPKRVWHPSP